MTKIYIDYENKGVLNHLNNSYAKIGLASQNDCNIPQDFKYRTLLNNQITKISNLKRSISKIRSWYQNSQISYELLEVELKSLSNSLSDVKINEKTSIIK